MPPAPWAVVQGLAPLHPPDDPAHMPRGVEVDVCQPRHCGKQQQTQRRLLHPGPVEVGQPAQPPALEEQGEQKREQGGYPADEVLPVQGLQGGRLLAGVHVELRRAAARRGPEDPQKPPACDELPAAVREHGQPPVVHVLVRQVGVVVLLRHLHPVAGGAGLRGGEPAEKRPPAHQPPALGLHVAVELLVLPQLIVPGVKSVPSPVHLSASSKMSPSATIRLSRAYSASRALLPAGVMA